MLKVYMNKDTLLTIAKSTGFSVSTVSRVLSGKGPEYRISQATIDLVTEEAKKRHYTPNFLAQSLRNSKTYTIGLVVPRIDNPFFGHLASRLISDIKDRGYHTILADSWESVTEENAAIKMLQTRGVDGIIAVPIANLPLWRETMKERPLVFVDRYFENESIPYVASDNYHGSVLAGGKLIDGGYRKILAIQGQLGAMSNIERVRGLRDVIASHPELHISLELVGDEFSTENGYNCVKEAFRDGVSHDAVYAFSSTILLGAIKAFHELGIRIPEQVGIISFDNNGFLDFIDPPVTRVEQPLEDISHRAVTLLIDTIEGIESGHQSQIMLPPVLITRESCRP